MALRLFVPAIDAHRRHVQQLDLNIGLSKDAVVQAFYAIAKLVGHEPPFGGESGMYGAHDAQTELPAHGRKRNAGKDDVGGCEIVLGQGVGDIGGTALVDDQAWIVDVGFEQLNEIGIDLDDE